MALKQLRGGRRREKVRLGAAAAQPRHAREVGCACETLESRRLFSTIHWANFGPGPNGDGFDGAYGANADLARGIVQRAIYDWQRVIVNFNYAGGGNTFELSLAAAPLGQSITASNVTQYDTDGSPKAAIVNLDDDAQGSGWYFDPKPADDAEFYAADGPFSALGAVAGALYSVNGNDLYREAAGAIGRALGMNDDPRSALHGHVSLLPGVSDPTYGGSLYGLNFNGGPIEATLTLDPSSVWDAFSFYDGPAIPGRPDIPVHPGDLFNAHQIINGRRLISDLDATVLRDAYGYTVAMPSTIDNMYVRPDYQRYYLEVQGSSTNDLIVVENGSTSNLVRATVNGYTEEVPVAAVGPIQVEGMSGNDIIRVEASRGLGVIAFGGDGDDFFDVAYGSRNLSSASGFSGFSGGNGFDQAFVYDDASTTAWTFTADDGKLTRPGWAGVSASVETTTLTTGTAADVVNVLNTHVGESLVLKGTGAAKDTVNLGGGTLATIQGHVSAQGAGLIHLYDFPTADARNYSILPTEVTASSPFAGLTYSGAPRIVLECTDGPNRIGIARGVPAALEVYGHFGDDQFILGDGFAATPAAGSILQGGGGGDDTITFDDHLNPSATTWGVGAAQVAFLGAGGSGTVNVQEFDTIGVRGGLGNDVFNVSGHFVGGVSIDAGGGNDVVNANGVRAGQATLLGGGGTDSLVVDDRSIGDNIDDIQLLPNRFDRIRLGNQVDPTVTYSIPYDDFETFTAYFPEEQLSAEIYGTSPDVPSGSRTTLYGGSSVGTSFTVYPHAGVNGAASIVSNLTLYGSPNSAYDSVEINDVGSATPANYLFSRYAATAGTIITGATPAGVELAAISTIDSIDVRGGAGDDTFTVGSQYAGTRIRAFGGAGDDVATFGNGALAGNAGYSFAFDGQEGTDTLAVANGAASILPYTYTRGVGTLGIAGTSEYIDFAAVITDANIELMRVTSSGRADTFDVNAVAAGTQLVLNAGGGLDMLRLAPSSNNLDTIRGLVTFDGGDAGGTVTLFDAGDTTGDVVHLDANSLGAFAGDTLFGPGGALRFANLANASGGQPGLVLNLGSGADTISAAPLAAAAVAINGNDPTVTPGDRLTLGLAGAQNPVVTGGAAGSVTSANLQMLSWTGIEQPPTRDTVAPAVLSAAFNVVGVRTPAPTGPRRQSIDVRFSENVSPRLLGTGSSSVELTNLTTGAAVPASAIAVAYNSATNTANFTFLGYANGVLPDGNYRARISASDAAGNAIAAPSVLDFYTLAGDVDRDRTVGPGDFNLLASNFGKTNQTWPAGDFDYDGVVGPSDFNLLASRFGTKLAPAATGVGGGNGLRKRCGHAVSDAYDRFCGKRSLND